MSFGGATYEPALDAARLKGQLERVRALMLDGEWRSLPQIRAALGNRDSEAGLSARLRQLRSCGYLVERRRRTNALHEYRVVPPTKQTRLFPERAA